jgi:hypothetical protein
MPRKPEDPASTGRTPPKRTLRGTAKGRRMARALARATLLAAGIAAVRFSTPEMDPRFEVFDRTLVDRLEAPITRHHE